MSLTNDAQARLTPVSSAERYEFLDVLRGAALFGIVTANTYLYSLYGRLSDEAKAALPTAATDGAVYFIELWLVEFKFYTLFSLLFGVGFSILLNRARAKGIAFHRFFVRRAAFLFLIGAAHAVFVWHDDILGTYALCGMFLLPFVSARPRTILAVAIAALLAPVLLHPLGGVPVGWLTDAQAALYERFGYSRETELLTYTQGSVADIVLLNACNWFGQVSYLVGSGFVFRVYGFFLLGFLFGRQEIYKQLPQHRALIRQIALWGLAVGLPLNFYFARVFETEAMAEALLSSFAVLPLSLAYAALLCLIWLGPEGTLRLRYFAPVGRMALTNYIGQSVICTLIFYSTGLGLAGTVGPTIYIPIGFGVYATQVAASGWWLARFRFGPLEWLWRMATYGKRIPLSKQAAPAADAA
jgi:uncharacterized protein